MGFSNNAGENMTFVKLRSPKKGETTPPVFVIKGKGEDGKWEDKETHNSFSGYLMDIETKDFEFQGNPGTTLITKWKDNSGATFQIEQNFKIGISRSLINSLAGIDNFGEIAMSLYTNKKGYASIWVKNDGQDVNWHTKVEDLPKPEPLKNKKGEIISYDDSDATEFYLGLVKLIKQKVDDGGLPVGNEERVTPSAKQVAASMADDAELPF